MNKYIVPKRESDYIARIERLKKDPNTPKMVIAYYEERLKKGLHFWGNTRYAVTLRPAGKAVGKTVYRTEHLNLAKKALVRLNKNNGDITTLYIGCDSMPLDYMKCSRSPEFGIVWVYCRKGVLWKTMKKYFVGVQPTF